MTEPTDAEIIALADETGTAEGGANGYILPISFARAVLAKWGTPQQEAHEPCPACIALARTVMLDQVSFDRKPDCYGIRQITDDEGIEEWEDIRTSPDVAREEANDMMATGRGEIYEVVPLWTTQQPTKPAPAAVAVPVGATHYQPHQKAYYKRLSATEWKLWAESRKEWIPSPGTSDSAQWVTLQAIKAHKPPAPAAQGDAEDAALTWTVFNSGAQVAEVKSLSEAMEYLTPARLSRQWCAVCVVNKSNLPAAARHHAKEGANHD